ncbi:MAG: hypothetical protein A2W38_00135 [Deltaproteobacteria bacterium RBG_19FT_COMBO_58_16]|nr:MAG: hypothetical protein A2W38_00135 [Deltaproteobacteria bacterium RBG_19FT_COMBO_58_16]
MSSKCARLFKTLLISGLFISIASVSVAAKKPAKPAEPPAEKAEPPYTRLEALLSIINPHEQVDDEGHVLWRSCLVCHPVVPDIRRKISIKDVQVRYADEDFNRVCRACHTVRIHPASEGISVTMSSMKAPDHLVVPSKSHYMSMRLTKKEIPMEMPLDPANGKIVCVTCHNPHERGLLPGRADWGGDSSTKLRTMGLDICQYCHRK